MPKQLSARALAAKILIEVLQKKRSLNTALSEQLQNYPKSKDRGFIQELCYGVLRWHEQLAATVKLLMAKPLKQADQDILYLLLIGIYQLQHLQTKPHAAIYETAQAARELKKPWAVGLINGVLREWQRQQAVLNEKINRASPDILYSHPAWLVSEIKQAWPQDWQTILTANNTRPPLTLRVNLLKISREAYLEKLNQLQIEAKPTHYSQAGIQLLIPQDVTQLPGYAEGEFSVQDEAAQLAADLLEPAPHQCVLDACAAPGGKTAHILETQPKLDFLLALDNDAQRLTRITDNLTRLQLLSNKTQLNCADAAQPDTWWDDKLFDRILLDAPCSATGVIRRHPDIKYLRKPEDIKQLNQLQMQLLNALWPLLKSGGIMLYATCSILPQENSLLLQQFMQQHPDTKEISIETRWGIATSVGRQVLPGIDNMDGFYYAKLQKN